MTSVNTYSEKMIKYIAGKEGFSRFPYNNNKTIGFGLDFYLSPDISINYESDGGISEKEGYRLLKIIMDEMKNKINIDLKEMNLKVKQNVFDSLIDLYYNRNSNDLTKEIMYAMEKGDDKKVAELFKDFDYKHAMEYLYDGDFEKSKANVEYNVGLKIRRKEEIQIYKKE